MFNETHLSKTNGTELTFIKSTNIKAFPCGRRRSEEVDKDLNPNTRDDKYHIPFDPEARLNTEANNIKHSGLNGFTQSFIQTKQWDENTSSLNIVLAGYLFTIKLETNYRSPANFGAEILKALNVRNSTATRIYANILTEELQLFSGEGFNEYTTFVLRNQTNTVNPETCLDLLNSTTKKSESLEEARKLANYYFSGLSFSTAPITEVTDDSTRSSILAAKDGSTLSQNLVSLCILKRDEKLNDDGEVTGYSDWCINEPARLPEIEHGDTENSVKLGDVSLEKLNASEIKQNGLPLAMFNVEETTDPNTSSKVYRLNFTSTVRQENS